MPRSPTLHYAGSLRIEHGRGVTVIGSGYAACCSGRRAERIREEGRHTYDRDAVTCRACLRQMERADG